MLQFPGLTMIHLVWEGPMPIDKAFDAMGDKDFGLYTIYGTHPLSGSDALLYIGQSNMQQFGGRLRHHANTWGSHEPTDLKVCLGRVAGWDPLTDEEWGNQIDLAERLTVYFTRPPANSCLIQKLKVKEPVLVLNHERRHLLPMSITNIPKLFSSREITLYGTVGHPPAPPPEAKEDEEADLPGRQGA
jgi:hypothetical protein